jgi:hypothetical protein
MLRGARILISYLHKQRINSLNPYLGAVMQSTGLEISESYLRASIYIGVTERESNVTTLSIQCRLDFREQKWWALLNVNYILYIMIIS